MEFRIERKSPFKVIGMQISHNCENKVNPIPRLWGKFCERVEQVENKSEPLAGYGICHNFDVETKKFDYIAAVGVDDDNPVPPEMISFEIPEQDYAVFECTLPTLMDTMGKIYDEWLTKSEYERSPGPEFEFYDNNFNPNDENSKLYLYIPVVKR